MEEISMKELLKSRKGIVTISALVIVIIVLILCVVKCSDSSDESKKNKDKTQTEQDNKDDTDEDDGIDWSDVDIDSEEISEGGLISGGGELGKKHPEDATEFPNDETITGESADSDDVNDKQDGDDTQKDEDDDAIEEWQGGTLY